MVWVSWGGSIATIIVYLTAPTLITVGGWRLVFFGAATAAAVMAAVWLWRYHALKMPVLTAAPVQTPRQESERKQGMRAVLPVVGMIMLAIVLHGILRDGITTWTPSYLSDAFEADSGVAILSSVVLPLFAIVCFQLTSTLNRKLIKNEMTCAASIFAAGLVALCVLRLAGTSSFLLTVLALAISVGSMHGVNLVFTCMIPPYLSRFGKTAFVSGLLNSCTYVGSALSMYGVAMLTQRCGWQATLSAWCLIALAGTLCCLLTIKSWRKIRRENGAE